MPDRLLRRVLIAMAIAGVVAVASPARAQSPADPVDADAAFPAEAVVRSIKLGLNKSLVVDLPRDARDVLVSNPLIADAVMRTPRRIYLTGVAVGEANIIIFDRAGRQIVTIELSVDPGSNNVSALLRRLIPGSDINVEVLNGNIILSGSVRNASDSRRAQDIADAFVNGGAQSGSGGSDSTNFTTVSNAGAPTTPGSAPVTVSETKISSGAVPVSKVINLLAIGGEDQVYLKVTIAEMERSIAKQLGINLDVSTNIGGLVASFITENPFAVAGKALSGPRAGLSLGNGSDINSTLRALDQTGMIKTLAEPTLSAISGESASFLAGGEFPIPSGFDATTGTVIIEFKPFGVSLNFSPVVLSEGRISLHVKTEVSELSTEGAVSLGTEISVPALKVRRAESTMELPSGGSMVLGGLLKDSVRQSISGFPGLKNLPVLGTLFRSRDFQRAETELVIIVTPYLVKPVASSALARPVDGFAVPSDGMSNFLGRLNRVYGIEGKPAPAGAYRGTYGFIFE